MVCLLAFLCLKCQFGVLDISITIFHVGEINDFSLTDNGLYSDVSILHKNVISQLLWFDI